MLAISFRRTIFHFLKKFSISISALVIRSCHLRHAVWEGENWSYLMIPWPFWEKNFTRLWIAMYRLHPFCDLYLYQLKFLATKIFIRKMYFVFTFRNTTALYLSDGHRTSSIMREKFNYYYYTCIKYMFLKIIISDVLVI